MNLGSSLPPVSSEAMTSLLELLAHPAEAKKVLEEMAKERRQIENATSNQREQYERLEGEAKKRQAENERAAAEAEEKLTQAAIQLGAAKGVLADAEARKEQIVKIEKDIVTARLKLDERYDKLEQQQKDLEDQLLRARERENMLDVREHKLDDQEKDLEIRHKALADEIAENDRWLENLKPPRRR